MTKPATLAPRDKRAAARFGARLPVRIHGDAGATLDISTHGVCFETRQLLRQGALVEFTLAYTLQGRQQQLQCEAKVLRVERRGDRYRVAARLLAPLFDLEEAAGAPR